MSYAETLRGWARRGELSRVRLSEDGKVLTMGDGTSMDGTTRVVVAKDGKSCEYSLASIFLQIIKPEQSLMAYRSACKKHHVPDMIKALDKPVVVGYFVGDASIAPSVSFDAIPETNKIPETIKKMPTVATATVAVPPPKKESRRDDKKDRRHKRKHGDRRKESSHHKRHRSDDRHRRKEALSDKKKKKAPITTEQMLDNLNVVVDKRKSDEGEDEIYKALSADGFLEVLTPELLRESTTHQDILALEIPVGNSASILRPAPSRDFQRVLDLWIEATERHNSKKNKSPGPLGHYRSYLIGKKPVIVLPKGLTPPITMLNAHDFFFNSRFVPRDIWLKQNKNSKSNVKHFLTHKFDARRGGVTVEFELMDNPRSKLGNDPKEWERIVAVLAIGASWQFKDWPRGYSNPVDLFSKSFGFFVGLEGDKLPKEITGWAVKIGKLSRDKRGLDSVCFANFWEGLEDRMVTKKPELMPQNND